MKPEVGDLVQERRLIAGLGRDNGLGRLFPDLLQDAVGAGAE